MTTQVGAGEGLPRPAGRPLPRGEVVEAGGLSVQRRHGNRRDFKGTVYSSYLFYNQIRVTITKDSICQSHEGSSLDAKFHQILVGASYLPLRYS